MKVKFVNSLVMNNRKKKLLKLEIIKQTIFVVIYLKLILHTNIIQFSHLCNVFYFDAICELSCNNEDGCTNLMCNFGLRRQFHNCNRI